MKKCFRRRFTLVELLGVIAILAILAAVGFGAYGVAQNKARISATEAVIQSIQQAMETARLELGYMPASNGWSILNGQERNNAVVLDFGDSKFNRKVERHLNSTLLSIDSSDQIVDSWGNPIYWRNPGSFTSGGIEIISAGPDGGFGKNNAGTPSNTLGDYKTSGKWECDDIANF
ncbi:MAG: type II secretion system protein GspG [Victivallaceae bacterium]|nr:type II secretion system protein GspG [Victivallaceae bacterium]